jgi:hypothetical protein
MKIMKMNVEIISILIPESMGRTLITPITGCNHFMLDPSYSFTLSLPTSFPALTVAGCFPHYLIWPYHFPFSSSNTPRIFMPDIIFTTSKIHPDS